MRRLLVVAAVLSLGLSCFGQIRVLVVDESKTLEESLRLLAAVRVLKATGAFSFQALPSFPTQPWNGEPFQVVVYVPAQSPYIWFCSPWPESALPESFRMALAHLRTAFSQAFLGQREVRGPGEDFYPLFLSFLLASRGYMGGK
ncbi:MAG: hypothetical protein ACPLRP_00320 [Candidatus Bipolaricaulaceae bacterium]